MFDFLAKAASWTGLILGLGVITEVVMSWALNQGKIFLGCSLVLVILWLGGLIWIGRQSFKS